ncbi:MAG: hypothetical protein CPDRYMAC_1098 [uncultured Paraburkholderia sp.]|nr:MAG: hypothetical protein CPDRYDRY_1074 [uncultured Paraburkholderia sp.]CAH2915891.1 MAG: hypothetical protein CPDRYMAC_1098 [uncultured Paraburkholderia sp.]
MIGLLELLIDISLTVASAAVIGSVFLLLAGIVGVTRRHLIRHRVAIRLVKLVRNAKHVYRPLHSS